MSKSHWKDFPGAPSEMCGCRTQVRRSLHAIALKAGQKAYRIKKCAQHAPLEPEARDTYPGVPDSAQYWW